MYSLSILCNIKIYVILVPSALPRCLSETTGEAGNPTIGMCKIRLISFHISRPLFGASVSVEGLWSATEYGVRRMASFFYSLYLTVVFLVVICVRQNKT